MTDTITRRALNRAQRRLPALAFGAIALVAVPTLLAGTTSLTAPNQAVAAIPGELPSTFADLVEKVAPAVVNVAVEVPADKKMGRPGMPPVPQGAPQGAVPPDLSGVGSGFIVDKSGYIVTNNHVVGEADSITITLQDGERVPATLVGRDPKTDLALVKIDVDRDLPTVRFGSSTEMRVGDWVLAVGSPFGLGGTVTTGILSARGRDIGAGPYDNFLQIDAAINRGNSGGPAFNLEGEVIGINTAIFSPTGGSVGIGFAIPSEQAQHVIAQLRQHGKVARGWLGVNIQTVNDDLADGLGMEKAEGALVANVSPNSPAEAAGLRQGDVIVGFNGERVESMRELPRLVARVPAGEDAEITVWRDGEEIELGTEIAALPEAPKEPVKVAETYNPEGPSVLGMTLTAIDEEARRHFGLAEAEKGVVVAEVDGNGPAAKTGLRPGDRILKIGGDAVSIPRSGGGSGEKGGRRRQEGGSDAGRPRGQSAVRRHSTPRRLRRTSPTGLRIARRLWVMALRSSGAG